MTNGKRTCILDMTSEEINGLVRSLDAPRFRAKQLQHWLYKRFARSFEDMSNLPSSLKIKLAEVSYIGTLAVINKQISGDGTMKVLLSLSDGHTIESALMKHSNDSGRERRTVCVSTQVGCAVGCSFCSTGQQGFVRNLTQGEITGQVLYFARYLTGHTDMRTDIHYRESRPVTNIVFMGMGEPLANYENMMRAVEVLNAPDGFGLGMRNITISTAGMVPQIMRLSNEKLQAGLAVSLHASDNKLRDKLVPLNKKYPLEDLIPACKYHYEMTGRRPSFEYTLFAGINDTLQHARSLAHLLQDMNCHVNLIAANHTADRAFRPPTHQVIHVFQEELLRLSINATIRQSRGQDIDAGCGQLRSRYNP